MASEETPNFGSDEFEVATEKKETRSGAYLVLGLAILGGGGYLFLKHGPASASAASTAVAETPSEAQRSIAEFLSMGGKDITDMQKNLQNTEQVVKQFNAYSSLTQVPLSDLKSNPFRADAIKKLEIAPVAPAPNGMSPEEAAAKALEESRLKALDAATKLRIESIMIGRNGAGGSAMINGEVVKAGGKVGDFTVESIKPGVVVVKQGAFRFERRMGQ